MPFLDGIAGELQRKFDAKNTARERSFQLSRAAIKSCSSAIRSVHRGQLDDAEKFTSEAHDILSSVRELLKDHPDVRYAGFFDYAEQDYAEARNVYSIIIKPGEGEYYMEIMEEIFYLLMLFDYPDAITRGLRRKSDLARSMIERTRGDLTNAVEIEKVEASLRCLMDKLKESDFGV
jgi:translin